MCHCFDYDPSIETRIDVPQSWDRIDGLTALRDGNCLFVDQAKDAWLVRALTF